MPGMVGVLNLDGSPLEDADRRRLQEAAAGLRGSAVSLCAPAGAPCGMAVSTWEHGPRVAGWPSLPASPEGGELRVACDGWIDPEAAVVPAGGAADAIAESYGRWGDGCPAHLHGDYAFALWDAREQRLLCARDTAQTKPFFYAVSGNRFLWASDPRPLLEHWPLSRNFDPVYLTTYMVIADRNWERTPYAAIRKLPGGHALGVERGSVRTWRWWQLPEPGSLRYRRAEEYEEHLRELLAQAVRARLRGAERVTVALSRGIDSASIAALGASALRQGGSVPSHLHCVTVGCPEHPEADESPGARRIAERLELPHRVVPATPEAWDARSALAQLAEPSGIVGYWGIWEAVAAGCLATGSRVLLTGQGGELVSCDCYLSRLFRARRYGEVARELWRWRRAGAPLARLLRLELAQLQNPVTHWAPVDGLGPYDWLRHPELCRMDMECLEQSHPILRNNHYDFVEVAQATAGLQPLFTSHGIELRHPLQDRRLVEFAYRLPVEWKLPARGPGKSLLNKPLLRRALAPELTLELPKPSASVRRMLGRHRHRYWTAFRDLLQAPPEALTAVADIDRLRERSVDLLQDRGGKRFLALTALLAWWLAAAEQARHPAVV